MKRNKVELMFNTKSAMSNAENKYALTASKKAQLKIQEMAFVILALALLAGIILIFVLRLQSGNLQQLGEQAKQQEALSLLERIAALPELNCQNAEICIDEDKAIIASQNQDKLRNLFQGVNKAQIRRLYPSGETLVIYQSGKGNQSYATFINLCKQEKLGISFDWNCGVGQLELEVTG